MKQVKKVIDQKETKLTKIEMLAKVLNRANSKVTFQSLPDSDRNLIRKAVVVALKKGTIKSYHAAASEFKCSVGIVSRWMDEAKHGDLVSQKRGRPIGSVDSRPRQFVNVDYTNRKNPTRAKATKKPTETVAVKGRKISMLVTEVKRGRGRPRKIVATPVVAVKRGRPRKIEA